MPIIKSLKQHRGLLDTHTWIWPVTGNSILNPHFRKTIEHALKTQEVLISPISVWEVGMLVDKRRIEVEMDIQDWVDQALNIPGIKIAPLTPKIAIQSTRLPGVLHADSADRILITTAHEENAVLATCDQKLLTYGEDQFVSVYDPCSERVSKSFAQKRNVASIPPEVYKR